MPKKIFFSVAALLAALAWPLWAESFEETSGLLKSHDPAVRLYAVRKIAVDYHGRGTDLLLAAA
ncbi:MAG TPA: hypothetical protein VJ417_11050, partial [Candidatus Glassbacteria bacterium]|nr:hypothetical protein [Candidatus Glassbacteria bacterium]